MAVTRHHMSINIEGLLRWHKRKKIRIMQHDDGTPMSDYEARQYIQGLLAQGHKLMACSPECEGFDPFEKGCPGHPVEEKDQLSK